MADQIEDIVLHEATRERYLTYALSVITARALPDVRDGLKPVQRRILYAMHHNLRLTAEARHRKSAAVVGEVMAKYHPHGDQSIYDAMVRMAQAFSLRYPLVDGQGNFGSIDGDNAAAMRYTEARLRSIAGELLDELSKETVDERPNYDGTLTEPAVLPAQVPNLLINGATGIAVGMATNIPPHNLREVIDALIALIDKPETTLEQLVGSKIKGPDFPTGGVILNTRAELREIYRTGRGAIELRGEFEEEREGGKRRIVITSVPYGLNKASLVADIADHIRKDNVPQLVDVRDESTEQIRVVLDVKRGASAEAAMTYLFKRTSLQTRFNVNLTALCPSDDEQGIRPRLLDVREVLELFLEFRYQVTQRRLRYDLEQLERRIHILEGFEIIFDALDEAIALIRASDGKADARERLMDRFALDYDQAEAILETKLYRLAKLEIDAIREELEDKRAQAAAIRETLASEALMWELIRTELLQIRDAYGDRRRTRIGGEDLTDEFSEEDYIVAEDAYVMVTREGWFKRQKSYTELDAVRVREGDEIGWILPSSTRHSLVLFTDRGRAYTMRVDDVPFTTGHGEPIQTRFDFADGESIVGAAVTDPRTLPATWEGELSEDDPPPPYVVAVSRRGRTLRLSLSSFEEPSTVNGRMLMKLQGKGDRVVAVYVIDGSERAAIASRSGRCILFEVEEAKLLSNAGKGVIGIKLAKDDEVLAFDLSRGYLDGLTVETNRGRTEIIRPSKYTVTGRGGRGREIIRRGYLAHAERRPIERAFREDESSREAAAGDADEAGDDASDDET